MDEDDRDELEIEYNPFSTMCLGIDCNEENLEPFADVPPTFTVAPTTWFVKEKTPGSGIWGQDLACAPGSYPDPSPFYVGPTPRAPGGDEDVKFTREDGWSAGKCPHRINPSNAVRRSGPMKPHH